MCINHKFLLTCEMMMKNQVGSLHEDEEEVARKKNHSGAISDSESLMKLEMMEKMGRGGGKSFLFRVISAVCFFLLFLRSVYVEK